MINQGCLAIAQLPSRWTYEPTYISIVQESIGVFVCGVDTVNAKWVFLHNFRSAASVTRVSTNDAQIYTYKRSMAILSKKQCVRGG